jgi:hypothetical protein
MIRYSAPVPSLDKGDGSPVGVTYSVRDDSATFEDKTTMDEDEMERTSTVGALAPGQVNSNAKR